MPSYLFWKTCLLLFVLACPPHADSIFRSVKTAFPSRVKIFRNSVSVLMSMLCTSLHCFHTVDDCNIATTCLCVTFLIWTGKVAKPCFKKIQVWTRPHSWYYRDACPARFRCFCSFTPRLNACHHNEPIIRCVGARSVKYLRSVADMAADHPSLEQGCEA